MAVHKIYNGTVWELVNAKVFDGAVWKTGKKFHDGVSFVDLLASPVSMATNDITNTRSNATAFAGVRFSSNGLERGSDSAGTFNVVRGGGSWLDSGPASNVWIERIINSGTLGWTDSGAGRLILSSNRMYGVFSSVALDTVVANVTFNMWDASTGGILLQTVTLNLSATKF